MYANAFKCPNNGENSLKIAYNACQSMQKESFGASLGRAVRERRKKLRMNQRQAALLSGCARLFVSEVERGKESVRLDKLMSLLRTLGLEIVIKEGRGEIVIDESV